MEDARKKLFTRLKKQRIEPDIVLEDYETLKQHTHHNNTYDCEITNTNWSYMISAYKILKEE